MADGKISYFSNLLVALRQVRVLNSDHCICGGLDCFHTDKCADLVRPTRPSRRAPPPAPPLSPRLARAVTSTPANAHSAPSQRPARKLLSLCLPSLTYHPRSGSAAPRSLARVSIGSRSRRALAQAAIGCTHTRPPPSRTDRLFLANLTGALSIIISTPHTDPSPPLSPPGSSLTSPLLPSVRLP